MTAYLASRTRKKNSIPRRFYVGISRCCILTAIFRFFPQFSCWYKITFFHFLCPPIGLKLWFLRFLSFLTSIGTHNFVWILAKFYSLDNHIGAIWGQFALFRWGYILPPYFVTLGPSTKNRPKLNQQTSNFTYTCMCRRVGPQWQLFQAHFGVPYASPTEALKRFWLFLNQGTVYKEYCSLNIYDSMLHWVYIEEIASFRFRGSILPYFWTNRRSVFPTTVRSFFDENILNQLYIRLCVQISDYFVCLNSYLSMYWLTHFKSIYRAHWRICVRNCQWWPFKTVKFQIHDGCPPLKILWVSKNSCNWNRFTTTYYIY